MQRVILHCDMNNFYASVECMLNPELKNKPVAVCGSVEERHGIVLAKNYAAKAFGVSTGEAIWQAKQKCQDLVIVEPHYEQYMKFSKLAREIYGRYTDQIEPYGINDSVPVHNDWDAAYYIIVLCELIPRTDTEDIRNPLLSSLRKEQSAGLHC